MKKINEGASQSSLQQSPQALITFLSSAKHENVIRQCISNSSRSRLTDGNAMFHTRKQQEAAACVTLYDNRLILDGLLRYFAF